MFNLFNNIFLPNTVLDQVLQFGDLSYKETNAQTDAIMDDRIKLTYDQAIQASAWVINSNDILRNSYRNYQLLKNKKLLELPPNTDVLLGSFVDKFKERIFFHVRHGANNESQYVYDVPSNKLFNYVKNTDQHCINQDPNLPRDFSNISYVNVGAVFDTGSIENIWHNNVLYHQINNLDSQNQNFNNDQPYVSDEYYESIQKNFTRIHYMFEINQFEDRVLESSHNPAHTLLSAQDIENEYQQLKFRHTKNTKRA